MPRPNPVRSLRSEANLARRIGYEREQRGWTYDGTAKRLTDLGCPIQPSAIYKIEKADPPRRISVDELVAFAQAFGVSVEDLLAPVELALSRELLDLFLAWDTTATEAAEAKQREEEALKVLKAYIADRPELAATVEKLASGWAQWNFPPDKQAGAGALLLTRLVTDPTRRKQYVKALNATLDGDR